jgi:hypothetical protein
MTKMKSTLAATFLTAVLSLPAMAGNIGTPGYTPPPPPPASCQTVDSTSSPATEDMDFLELSSAGLVDILIAVLSLV